MLLPPIVLGGIFLGLFTPVEADAIGCAFALAVATLVRRSLSLRGLMY